MHIKNKAAYSTGFIYRTACSELAYMSTLNRSYHPGMFKAATFKHEVAPFLPVHGNQDELENQK